MKRHFLAFTFVLLAAMATAQEAPTGKPIITIFGNFHSGLNEAASHNLGFEIDRAYLGYQVNLNENWSAKVIYDMGESSMDGANQRIGFLKNAMVGYKHGNLQVNAGLTDCEAFTFQQNFWGYRYLYKSFMDKNGWDNSADLGMVGKYNFAEWISADLSIFNGEGFKKIQLDDQLSYGLGLTINPVKGLYFRCYGEMKTARDTTAQEILSAFVGYKNERFRVGAEYNMMANQKNVDGHSLNGFSVYGTGILTNRLELYARYDKGISSAALTGDSWIYGKNGQTAIFGLQYKASKLFTVSPNLRWEEAEGQDGKFFGYISTQVKF